ncbi:MAG TPA: RHS repeat-associated core domain-containing protein, partial [Terriglobales bacterium]|nr:RHS repeat-associated core domain-containing protein [Terriglobales bacterium]
CTGNDGSSLGYAEMWYDNEDALNTADYRNYQSVAGRWLTPDPAGLAAVDPTNPQTWNRYAYVTSDPVSLVDPLGLSCEDPTDGESCVVNVTASAPSQVAGIVEDVGEARIPYITPGAVPARNAVLSILSTPNPCSSYFNNAGNNFTQATSDTPSNQGSPDQSAANIFGSDDIRLNPNKPTVGAQSQQGAGANTTIFINPNGPFFISMPTTQTYFVGPFPGGSPQAQATILFHEFDHTINGIPGDGTPINGLAPGANVGQSKANTNVVLFNCYSQINSIGH